ncbi:MAG TPA: hypothetical protein VG186_01830 [Solirubrobacteraceae bacterium]|jgi:hypothetical protein|nr:hypothetical protein [Solirubrobacteraceae bacterium]
MSAREVEAAARDLARRAARGRHGAVLAGLCALLAAGAAPFASTAAAVFALAAALAALLAITNHLARREVVARLALDPEAYVLPDVYRYGVRLTRSLERERLADWLLEVIRDCQLAGSSYLADRVEHYTHQLESLAEELAAPAVSVRPSSAAACHLLLTQAVDSPLYNPAVPAGELAVIIARIRSGILPQ